MRCERNEITIFTLLKAVAFALAIAFVAIVVFACVLRVHPLSEKTVYFADQSIKTIAVILATLFFVRGEKGWLQGGTIGLLFTCLSYLTCSVIAQTFSLSAWAIAELAIGVLSGAAAGAIAVNLR